MVFPPGVGGAGFPTGVEDMRGRGLGSIRGWSMGGGGGGGS